MLLRQLFDHTSSTYTYLLADAGEAVLIDCVFEQHARDAALLRELGLKLRYTLDTHCHADHVTGAWLMKHAVHSQVALPYAAENADVRLAPGDRVHFGGCALEVRATPGHTDSCVSYVIDGHVFTGDALLVRGAGRTDFQHGSAERLYHSIKTQLFTLPDDTIVHPAHDYEGRISSTIGEERAFNPRIGGGAREEDFVGYMRNLALPHPKQIAVAVPANLRAGKPDETPQPPAWGPVVFTYAGVPEVDPEWVAAHRDDVFLLDVRHPDEPDGIDGARVIPLDALRDRAAEVPSDKPVVILCQSGRRSALAAAILTKAGHARVASLAGGLLRWRERGL